MKYIRFRKSQKQLRDTNSMLPCAFASLFSRKSAVYVLVILACTALLSSSSPAQGSANSEVNSSVTLVPIDKVRDHYQGCLAEKEIEELIRLKTELEDMESMKALDPKLQIEPIIKDDKATDDLCDQLPSIFKAIKYARELGKFIEKNVRTPRYNKNIAKAYKDYIKRQVELNFCTYYDNLTKEEISPTVANSLGKSWPELQRLFRAAAEQYCRDMKDLRTKISEIENRCLKVPNLIGLTYDTSLELAPKAGFTAPLIQQADILKLPADQRAPMIIYKQDPQPDELRPALFAIKVWVRNDLKSLKADPPSWHNARTGETNSFVITAEFLNGKELVTADCTWSSIAPGIASPISPKGAIKATGPGEAEILAFYRFNDGAKWASGEVRIPVRVLAAVKPPEGERKLLSFELQPQGPIDITIGAPPLQLRGVATFSDKPDQKIDVTEHCKSWRSDGKPDLTVSDGLVEAHDTKLSPSKHKIHAIYSFGEQRMQDSVLFQIATPPPEKEPITQYSRLSLDKSGIVFGMQSTESIRATAWVAKLSRLFQEDVTFDSNITWASSSPSIAEFVNGAITSKTSAGSCVITATLNPPGAKKPLTAQCKVTVQEQPMLVDFDVKPSGPYTTGQEITFFETIQTQDKSRLDLIWYVENREVLHRDIVQHTFQKPGKYQVRLVARNRKTGVEDAMAKSITVEQPPDMEVTIGFDPEINVYQIGTNVGFIAKTEHAKGITEYRWYVNGEYVGSGKDNVQHKFTEEGEYEIKLGLRMGSNFDEVKVTRPLIVGEAGIGTLGRERNRFEAQGAPEKLEILSSYWIGGKGEWSKPVIFDSGSIGAVDHYILYTGNQLDGYNTGFLVYVPRGRNCLEFRVFHFSWADAQGRKPHGTMHYNGILPLHNKTPISDSLRFTRQSSRFCEVEWRATDESSCRVRIGKFRKTEKDAFSGVTDLGCEYDNMGWKTEHKGPHGSISPKADQWAAGGGFVVMSGSHKFEKHWFRFNNEEKDPFYLNDEDTKSPPRHSYDEVMREAKIKQGTLKVRGHGYLLIYSKVKGGSSPFVALKDTNTGKNLWAHFNDDTKQTMYQSRNWVFKDGKWEGAWTGKWTGMGKDVDCKHLGGRVPPGQIKTLEVFIEQYWYHKEFCAPTEIEYEIWFFPREGGGVKIEK